MLNPATQLCITAAGVFLISGMGIGILKYRAMLMTEDHRAPPYIDIAHRAALLYSFAALVMGALANGSLPARAALLAAFVPLGFFALTIVQYARLGLSGQRETQFSERNFTTVPFMYALIAGEIGGVAVLLWGFIQQQFF